jgi:hypothetical protein
MRIARQHIAPLRSALLDRVIADQRTYTMGIYEFGKIEIALRAELAGYSKAA